MLILVAVLRPDSCAFVGSCWFGVSREWNLFLGTRTRFDILWKFELGRSITLTTVDFESGTSQILLFLQNCHLVGTFPDFGSVLIQGSA